MHMPFYFFTPLLYPVPWMTVIDCKNNCNKASRSVYTMEMVYVPCCTFLHSLFLHGSAVVNIDFLIN